MIVDLDGTTQDVYEYYRVRGELRLVLDNIKRMVKAKSELGIEEPIIEAKMLVMRHNEHQISEFIKLAESLGVDKISTGTIQVNPNESMDWLPENDRYVYPTYSKTKASLTVLPSKTKKQCHWLWSGLVINFDGGISPCCIVEDEKADFGNVFDEDVLDIWNNNKYQTARSEFVSECQDDNLTICNVCKNNTHDSNLNRVGDSFSIML
jgi:radical SAM protein with 4Fe4S-binding SPASM domain